jgi:ribonucleotide monophosphatase NagD (HAD superfamily)
MADLVRQQCGPDFTDRTAIMIGDRWTTDGLFAQALGCPFALVRTGVTPLGTEIGGVPRLDLGDLSAVASVLLG